MGIFRTLLASLDRGRLIGEFRKLFITSTVVEKTDETIVIFI